MKMSFKISACAIAVSILVLACDDTGNNNTEQNGFELSSSFVSSSSNARLSSSSENSSSGSFETAGMPVMDSRVVSYQRTLRTIGSLSNLRGFINDKDSLEMLFPHMLGNGIKEECSYFAIYFYQSSYTVHSYEVLSQDMALHLIGSVFKEGSHCPATDATASHIMLICDDEAGTLKSGINLDYVQLHTDPDWACDGEIGDVFF